MVSLDVNVDLTLEIDGEEKVVRMSLVEAKALHAKLGEALGKTYLPFSVPAPYPQPYPVPYPYIAPRPWIGQPVWRVDVCGSTTTTAYANVKSLTVGLSDAPQLKP